MLLWKTDPGHVASRFQDVSILVLLDVALKVRVRNPNYMAGRRFQSLFSWMLLWKHRISSARGPPFCFNPCSLGCCSESSGCPTSTHSSKCFNPCSLGCCSESLQGITRLLSEIKFQSLFSWMLLWKATPAVQLDGNYRGFNPCSLGCCSESLIP